MYKQEPAAQEQSTPQESKQDWQPLRTNKSLQQRNNQHLKSPNKTGSPYVQTRACSRGTINTSRVQTRLAALTYKQEPAAEEQSTPQESKQDWQPLRTNKSLQQRNNQHLKSPNKTGNPYGQTRACSTGTINTSRVQTRLAALTYKQEPAAEEQSTPQESKQDWPPLRTNKSLQQRNNQHLKSPNKTGCPYVPTRVAAEEQSTPQESKQDWQPLRTNKSLQHRNNQHLKSPNKTGNPYVQTRACSRGTINTSRVQTRLAALMYKQELQQRNNQHLKSPRTFFRLIILIGQILQHNLVIFTRALDEEYLRGDPT